MSSISRPFPFPAFLWKCPGTFLGGYGLVRHVMRPCGDFWWFYCSELGRIWILESGSSSVVWVVWQMPWILYTYLFDGKDRTSCWFQKVVIILRKSLDMKLVTVATWKKIIAGIHRPDSLEFCLSAQATNLACECFIPTPPSWAMGISTKHCWTDWVP